MEMGHCPGLQKARLSPIEVGITTNLWFQVGVLQGGVIGERDLTRLEAIFFHLDLFAVFAGCCIA